MKSLVTALFFALTLLVPLTATRAQFSFNEGRDGEVTATPICGQLVNRSDQTILGSIATMPAAEGGRFEDNFRLAAGEKTQICSSGPFYAGRRLEIVIRTLIPLFDCKTRIDRDVFLEADEDENGFRKLRAICY